MVQTLAAAGVLQRDLQRELTYEVHSQGTGSGMDWLFTCDYSGAERRTVSVVAPRILAGHGGATRLAMPNPRIYVLFVGRPLALMA